MPRAKRSPNPTVSGRGGSTRLNRQLELSAEAFIVIERVRARLGMTQKQLLSRMVEWFAAQGEEPQHLIVGRLPERYCADAALRLARTALELRGVKSDVIVLRDSGVEEFQTSQSRVQG